LHLVASANFMRTCPAPLAGNPGSLGMTKGMVVLPFGVMVVMTAFTTLVHCSLNLQRASQAAPNDTEARVRNNPTQAKRRLEWATPNFLAGRGSRCHFLPRLTAGKLAAGMNNGAVCSADFNRQSRRDDLNLAQDVSPGYPDASENSPVGTAESFYPGLISLVAYSATFRQQDGSDTSGVEYG
jgi:hypothetical protein